MFVSRDSVDCYNGQITGLQIRWPGILKFFFSRFTSHESSSKFLEAFFSNRATIRGGMFLDDALPATDHRSSHSQSSPAGFARCAMKGQPCDAAIAFRWWNVSVHAVSLEHPLSLSVCICGCRMMCGNTYSSSICTHLLWTFRLSYTNTGYSQPKS